jgi:hypothetical protein
MQSEAVSAAKALQKELTNELIYSLNNRLPKSGGTEKI